MRVSDSQLVRRSIQYSTVLLLALVITFPSECPAQTAAQLPQKIRITPDGRGFQTADGRPFAPCGVNYFRPGTGWAPQVWKQFDPEGIRADFTRLKAMGMNCVRVFLSYGSFYKEKGVLDPEGVAKFDQFLALAEAAGIYVHPAGLDHWEGPPNWKPVGVEEDGTVQALEEFWKLFAARYRDRNVIFAYDLKNEPEVGWKNATLKAKWGAWLRKKYTNEEALKTAWGATNSVTFTDPSLPSDDLSPTATKLVLDYQLFREDLADEWTRRQVAAIKAADSNALVTVGLIQWSVPSFLPAGPRHYSGFSPRRQGKLVDFLEIHFYPLANGVFQYESNETEMENLACLESVLCETARAGKPVVLAEFGWYGGGTPTFQKNLRNATERQQAIFGRKMLEVSEGWVVGWLNWGFHDHPQANDCTQLSGLLTVDGTIKEWGKTLQDWGREHRAPLMDFEKSTNRPALDWNSCVTSRAAGDKFRQGYIQIFLKDSKI